jgi:hypothetical protein
MRLMGLMGTPPVIGAFASQTSNAHASSSGQQSLEGRQDQSAPFRDLPAGVASEEQAPFPQQVHAESSGRLHPSSRPS